MALSIREQIMAHWVTTLESISLANGYQTNIDKVERFRLTSMDQVEQVVIEVKQGVDRNDQSGTLNLEGRVLSILTMIKVRHDPEADEVNTETLINQLEQDIHKAVMADRTRGATAFTTFFDSSEPIELDEAGGRAGKAVNYTVLYRHVVGDMTNG
ncbi:MAG: hypothetical protein OEQ18_02145 [Gammaproteobacteria bacterium]|nr:hypothetical protein [Gammaproteobacteria bacterium]